jgi:hypothetical protein
MPQAPEQELKNPPLNSFHITYGQLDHLSAGQVVARDRRRESPS